MTGVVKNHRVCHCDARSLRVSSALYRRGPYASEAEFAYSFDREEHRRSLPRDGPIHRIAPGMSAQQRSIRPPWLSLIGSLLLLCGIGASHAASNDPWAPFEAPWFDKASSAECLPPSIITSLAQDRRGLLWVGTMVGLSRGDGYRTQLFNTRGDDGKGLPDAYVRSLLTLPDGGLLIGANAGGMARFNPATARFRTYPIGPTGTSDRKIYALADDHAGGVWIATDRGLDHLDLRSNQIRQLKTGADTAPRNFSVRQDRAGNLWLGNDNGLFVRHAGTATFVRPEHPHGSLAVVLANQIWAMRGSRRSAVGQQRPGRRGVSRHRRPVASAAGVQRLSARCPASYRARLPGCRTGHHVDRHRRRGRAHLCPGRREPTPDRP
jgi:hypothetical protein